MGRGKPLCMRDLVEGILARSSGTCYATEAAVVLQRSGIRGMILRERMRGESVS